MDSNASPSRYAQSSVTWLPRRPKQLSEKVYYPANLGHVPRQWKQNKDFFLFIFVFICLLVSFRNKTITRSSAFILQANLSS